MGTGHGVTFCEDGAGGIEMFDFLDELATGSDIERLHGAFDARDCVGASAKFIDAEAEEEGGEENIAGHFATDADPETAGVGGIDGHLNEANDRWVGGFVEMGDAFVEAIDSDGVLDEVVGADAEEIDFFGEDVSGDGGARNFDHGTDFHLGIERDAFGTEFGPTLFEEEIRVAEFIDARNHGVHHFDISMGTGAKDGTELGFKNIDVFEAEADGAPAEEGVEFFGYIESAHRLVATEVEGPNDDIVWSRCLSDLEISGGLFVFGGEFRFI